ncbi:MAG: glycosyltransferase family 39 protein [Thermodesulfobacteriota bacterium]
MTLDQVEAHAVAAEAPVADERETSSAWWYVPALLFVALLLLTPWQRDRPLHGDAAMYAAISKTVAQTGELTRLTFNGLPYLNKPPLFFWLTAGAFDVLGVSDFAAQLVSGLLGVVNALVLFAVCRRMGFDAASAFGASLAYVTTPEVVHWTRGVHLESLLTFWLLLGVLAAYLSLSRPRAILLLGVAAAGGWMSKGPQGLFGVAIAPLLWWRDGLLRARLRSRWLPAAALVVLAIVGPWTWARLTEGTGYAETYFRGQIGGVLVDSPDVYRRPLWYLVKLLESYWPWLPFALVGIVSLARRWREDPAARAWLVYGALVMAITTAASVRRPRYLAPLYPMLAVPAGVTLGKLARTRPRLLSQLVAVAVAAGVVVAVFDREKSTEESNRMRAEAVEVARALPADVEVWLASDVPQEGMPGITKVLGFYARPLLCACGARCRPRGDARQGLRVVTLAQSADALARETGASIEMRNRTLAVLRPPLGSRDRLRAQICALEPVMLPW